MNAPAALANTVWLAANLGASRRYALALADPRSAQDAWLRAQLARHADSAFGQQHDFSGISGTADFTRRVPLTDYAGVEPYVQRIARGERDVLACGRVTHLAPTSGSTGARKLIPFSAALQEGFNAAVGAWMLDLVRQRPSIVAGPAYWSVSPLADDTGAPSGAVPVGFADDADYLGGASAWLVRKALAAPADLRHVRDMDAFRALTLLALLRQRDLRLLSVWHPSFLDLITDAAESHWPELLGAVATGHCPWLHELPPSTRRGWSVAPAPARARELQRIGPWDWTGWWPNLQVVSCWGEQAAEAGWRRLRARLPHVLVQAKGLLATEAVVTIPVGADKPLAVTSHFIEFIDEQGDLRLAHELSRGARYEVVVTNGGGLWRYRLGDVVECDGFVRATPSLRFVGRAGRVSDLRGEKLSEAFVAEALRSLWNGAPPPAYAALRARASGGNAGYELLISTDLATPSHTELGARLDSALGANPHYAIARRLGQLAALQVVTVDDDRAHADLAHHDGRLGDAKPRVLLDPVDVTG